MESLLQIIESLHQDDISQDKVFQMFSRRTRELYGACATALICTEGLQPAQCRVLELIDHKGNPVIENMDVPLVQSDVPVYQSGFITEILNRKEPVIFRGDEYGIDPIFRDLFSDYIDLISLPLYQAGDVNRWLFYLFSEKNKVDTVDIERSLLISTLASNYVLSVINARKLEQANRWIERELEAVGRMQQLLLPQDLDDTPGVKIASYFVPHAYVGGDYYDIANLSDVFGVKEKEDDPDSWGFMVADASGHGAAAAVEIAMYDAILRTYTTDAGAIEAGPAGVFTYTNKHFFTRLARGNFITAFVSSYVPQNRTLIYANAGHPPPIIKSRTGQLAYLDQAGGIPLGILQDYSWENGTHEMQAGDILILFTDGIIEATSPQGEMFGQQRLEKIIQDTESDADKIMNAIKQALLLHQGDEPQRDDQTLIVIQALL